MAELDDPDDVSRQDNPDHSESVKSDNVQNNDIPDYKTAGEYCNAVNKWLWQCYYAQCFAASLPYVFSASWQQQGTTTDLNRNITPNNLFFNQPANNLNNVAPASTLQRTNQHIGCREYLLPPLWKRFLAEVIDFFILLILKLMVTYIAVDFFEVIDLEKYDLDILREDKIMDYKAALEMTSDIVLLEIIHRFVVCIFEGLCLHRGALGPGGATPGKSFFDLRVVKCLAVENLPNNRIRVYPAEDIGLGWSFLRAFVKNFSMAFLQPACLTIFVFQHNRAAYDMICKSIVVEDLARRPPARLAAAN